MARSLNKVQLIGNLTRDPELRYTPNGNAVVSFGMATNRVWTTDNGEKREEADFHKIVAWNKLAELCSQFLTKGRKVYVEGRLSTRSWTGQDGSSKQTTEVIIDNMILLDNKGLQGSSDNQVGNNDEGESHEEENSDGEDKKEIKEQAVGKKQNGKSKKKEVEKGSNDSSTNSGEDEVKPDDIPF